MKITEKVLEDEESKKSLRKRKWLCANDNKRKEKK